MLHQPLSLLILIGILLPLHQCRQPDISDYRPICEGADPAHSPFTVRNKSGKSTKRYQTGPKGGIYYHTRNNKVYLKQR